MILVTSMWAVGRGLFPVLLMMLDVDFPALRQGFFPRLPLRAAGLVGLVFSVSRFGERVAMLVARIRCARTAPGKAIASPPPLTDVEPIRKLAGSCCPPAMYYSKQRVCCCWFQDRPFVLTFASQA